MCIYFKLAAKYIISNKTKSTLVILGFSLAVVLAVAIGNIFNSVITTEIYRHKIDSFGYDFGYSGLKGRNVNTINKIIHRDKNVESTGIVAQFGSSVLKDDLHIYLRSYDNTALRMFGIKLKEGAMPQRNNEACLEEWILLNMKNKPQIGQKFKFHFIDSNGTEENVEFTLSGILEDTKDNISSSKNINILLLNHMANLRNDSEINIYVKLKNYAALYAESLRILNQVNMDFSKYSEIKNLQFIKNDDYLMNLTPLNSFSTYKIVLTLFAIGISVLLIFNLISISVAERIRQYGLLRSIGISGRQLKLVIIIEAILLCIPSIPIGTAAGCIFARTLIKIISPILDNRKIYSVFNFDMVIFVTIAIIIVAVIASLIPGEKAAKLTPVEACRCTGIGDDIENRKSVLEKLLGMDITKFLAICDIKRNKGKAFFTVASLALSGFVFLVVNYFYIFVSDPQIEKSTILTDFELKVNNEGSERFTAADVKKIQKMNGVKEAYAFNTTRSYLFMYTDKPFVEGYKPTWGQFGYVMEGTVCSWTGLLGCNDALLDKLNIDKNVLQGMKINNSDYLGVLSTRLSRNEASSLYKLINKHLKVYATTSVYFDPDKIKKASPRVYPCATVYLDSPVPFGYGGAAFYMTNSSFEKLTGLKGYSNIYINMEKGADRDRIASALKKLAGSKSTGRLKDAVESLGIVRKFFNQISLLILGLSFLILIIGVISMYITIKSNILLQMNELGILRAVGMSRKGLKRLFLYEGMVYGIFSSAISLIASILFCCVVFSTPEISASPFVSAFRKIPWIIFISTFWGNIVLCICITLISIRSVFDLSIVEAIKSN